jgi:uncharacterized protein YndB with AHSA1/START domain
MDDLNLTIERTFDAPAEAVFDAWTSAEVVRRWWRVESNWSTAEAEVDARVGGRIHVTMHNPDKGENYGGGGLYTEVDRPNRLAFTWKWDEETRKTLIEIDFEEEGGRTTVSFHHRNLLDMETLVSHRGGWNGVLDHLGEYLAAEA